MAKKSNHRHGIQSAPCPPVVRWLGAFGFQADLDALVAFESNPHRLVSGEPCFGGVSRLIKCKPSLTVGLVLDTDKTSLNRCYSSDAYTATDKNGLSKTRRKPPCVRTWDSVAGLSHAQNRYGEALFSSPVYKAVLCVKPSGMAFAQAVAQRMGLPVVLSL